MFKAHKKCQCVICISKKIPIARSQGLRGKACLGTPDGKLEPSRVHVQGGRVAPSWLRLGCCQSLSTQPGRGDLAPCDADPPCYPGSDGPPTCLSHPIKSVVEGQPS